MLILALILASASFGQNTTWRDNYLPPCPDGVVPGRFQLLSATVCTDGEKPEAVVMRIDTVTGAVWIYNQIDFPVPRSGGKSILTAGWVQTTENLSVSIDNSKRLADSMATNHPPHENHQ